jgi:hypothetical protein
LGEYESLKRELAELRLDADKMKQMSQSENGK